MGLSIPKNLSLNFASMVFLGVSIFTFWQGTLWDKLSPIYVIGFLIAGLLISGLVIGKPLGAIHKRFSTDLIEANQGELNESIINKIRFTGTIVMLLQILVIFYATNFAIKWLIGMG